MYVQIDTQTDVTMNSIYQRNQININPITHLHTVQVEKVGEMRGIGLRQLEPL